MKILSELIKDIATRKIYGNTELQIAGIADDSREIIENYIFVAIKGLTFDGHNYILQAIKHGALAVIGEKDPDNDWLDKITYIQADDSREALGKLAAAWFDQPSQQLKVIGVTGTKGKSTTAYMIHEILEKSGISVGSVTSINAKIKDEELDTGLHVTNPSPIALNSFLKKMVDKKCEYAILEVTSHGLDQKRTAGIKFDIGVLTNIKHEHLDYHKTFQAYKQAKAKLFSDINTVVLNKDDKESFEFIKSITDSEVNIITYSLNSNSDYLIINIKTDRKMSFSIKEGNQNHKIETEFLGDFNALNLAAAIAVARNEGLDWDNITSAIKTIKSPLGRMEKIANDKSLNIYIDFAHTPDSLEKVLQFLKKKYPQGKLISVFGCASERDVLKRPMMGKISTQLAEVSIFTAEDPRSEDINKIINEMAAGVDKNLAIEGDLDSPEYKNTHLYYKFPQRGDAISFAINKVAQSGDTIVICGKGHEKSMAYYGIEYPWSDHKAIELALKGKSYKIAYEK